MQYFQVLLCLFHKIMSAFQSLYVRILQPVFPVDGASFAFAFQVSEYHNVGYKHGNQDEHNAGNIIRIVVERMGEKGNEGKAAVKENGYQAKLPQAFLIGFFLKFQTAVPDGKGQEE